MKILMSNAKNDFLLAPQYFKAWQKEPIHLESFFENELNAQKFLFPHQGLDFRIFNSLYRHRINKALINLAEDKKPDIILLFKSALITPRTLSILKNKKIKLVNYNPDHPYSLSGNHSAKYLAACVPFYDLYITYSDIIIQEIKRRHPKVKTCILPFGYHQDILTDFNPSPAFNKICFIGTADKERLQILRHLIINKVPLDLYGPGWKKYIKTDNTTRVFNGVQGIEYYETLGKYSIQLNLFRKQNYGSHNMRSFEINRSGSIMLSPTDSDHHKFFEENSAYFNYKDMAHMVKMSKSILEMDQEKIRTIRNKIDTDRLKNKYSYADRAKQLLSSLEAL